MPDDGFFGLTPPKGNTNGWLEIKLVGTASNRSGVGAKIRVHATISGKGFWQMRAITTGGGRWV